MNTTGTILGCKELKPMQASARREPFGSVVLEGSSGQSTAKKGITFWEVRAESRERFSFL